MRFAYRPYPADPSPADPSDEVARPALKVRIRGRSAELPLWGIIDTGAVDCILPEEVGRRVEPEWSREIGVVVGFSGRPTPVRYGRVVLQIRLGRSAYRWPATVAFARDRDEALWGVAGFLEYFRVTFDGPGRHFTLRDCGALPPDGEVERASGRRIRRKGPSPPIDPDEQEP